MGMTNALNLLCGLALFLYGMHVMGEGLTRASGGRLEGILESLTKSKIKAVLLGAGVTAVIQSSSATTVMVVGFVNSGIMRLSQAAGVIMGANIGTTITSWILSLTGLQGDSLLLTLCKPATFTPVLAFIGVCLLLFAKGDKKHDAGSIMIGFAVLMTGMEMMSSAVKPLANVPEFTNLLLMFTNPVLGVIAGALLTAIIQSSSASVGILQALASTGQVSYAAAVPIIMGQNIGTCVTALISCVGTNKNAKRAAVVHLMFNVIGVAVLLTVFCIVKAIFAPVLLNKAASMAGIAVAHSVFNILCTAILLPCGDLLEKLAIRLVPDKAHAADKTVELDQRLLTTPAVALERCRVVTCEMAEVAVRALQNALRSFDHYTEALASSIREDESRCDHYEDVLGTYLVKLSAQKLGEQESEESAELLKAIGDFERISDHAVNVLESAEELREKGLAFSDEAKRELSVLSAAVNDILMRALDAFRQQDMTAARQVEPLEQVIDDLKEQLRTRHILRMQQGQCSIEAGFVWSDLLTDLERTSDHCSNIAGCVIDAAHHDLNMHATLDAARHQDPDFREQYRHCAAKYQV